MKLLIAGSRGLSPTIEQIDESLRYLLDTYDLNYPTEVISGTAQGVDQAGEKWANESGILIRRFPANWESFGRAAGPIRNEEMGRYCDAALIFWDGKSKGTEGMIEILDGYRIPYVVFS